MISRGLPTVARAISTMRRSKALRSRPSTRAFARKADEIERLGDQPRARLAVGRDIVDDRRDIVGGREVFDNLLVLESAADAEGRALVRHDAAAGPVRRFHGADRWRDEAGKHVDERGLAGAIGADEAGDRLGQARGERVEARARRRTSQ